MSRKKNRIKCRVKAIANDEEQTVYFSPKLVEEDEELTISETVCKLKRGKTNYVIIDVMNLTRKDKKLYKGSIVGSVQTVWLRSFPW